MKTSSAGVERTGNWPGIPLQPHQGDNSSRCLIQTLQLQFKPHCLTLSSRKPANTRHSAHLSLASQCSLSDTAPSHPKSRSTSSPPKHFQVARNGVAGVGLGNSTGSRKISFLMFSAPFLCTLSEHDREHFSPKVPLCYCLNTLINPCLNPEARLCV